jgi:hypothetical protein
MLKYIPDEELRSSLAAKWAKGEGLIGNLVDVCRDYAGGAVWRLELSVLTSIMCGCGECL